MLTDGLHALVSSAPKNNKMVVVAGLAADVRLACDHLMKRSSTPLQIHHIDHWTTGRADNKPYRFARSSIEILTTYKLDFEVHNPPPPIARTASDFSEVSTRDGCKERVYGILTGVLDVWSVLHTR